MSRTQRFLQLQNLKAHYKNMIETTPTYIFTAKNKKIFLNESLYVNNKAEKNRNYQVKRSNEKLFNNLHTIFEKKSKQLKQKNSYTIPLKKKITIDDQIQIENLRFIKKLRKVTPSVGSRSEWKKHFKEFKEQKRKLSRSNNVSITKQSVTLSVKIDSLKKQLTTVNKQDSPRVRKKSNRPFSSINGSLRNQTLEPKKSQTLQLIKPRYQQQEQQQEQNIRNLKQRQIYADY